jgi:hypothetical protein
VIGGAGLAALPTRLASLGFTGRWRDDKAAEDATTTRELAELFLTARHQRTMIT